MDSPSLFFDAHRIKKGLMPFRSPSRIALNDPHFIQSAVLFLLIPHEDRPYDLVLIRRTNRRDDKHAGEISFPGGKFDINLDGDLQETALRECEEELGISREKIHILGSFNDHITPQGFIITPIVGYVDNSIKMKRQEEEVAEIIKIPVNFFIDKKKYRERTYYIKEDLIAVGKYKYRTLEGKSHVIFGATTHLIVDFLQNVYKVKLMKEGARRLTCADLRDKITR